MALFRITEQLARSAPSLVAPVDITEAICVHLFFGATMPLAPQVTQSLPCLAGFVGMRGSHRRLQEQSLAFVFFIWLDLLVCFNENMNHPAPLPSQSSPWLSCDLALTPVIRFNLISTASLDCRNSVSSLRSVGAMFGVPGGKGLPWRSLLVGIPFRVFGSSEP